MNQAEISDLLAVFLPSMATASSAISTWHKGGVARTQRSAVALAGCDVENSLPFRIGPCVNVAMHVLKFDISGYFRQKAFTCES